MSANGGTRLVAGRYLLLERLGSGGMGTVWRASDQLLGRVVAVKEVHPDTGGEVSTKQAHRAHREAQAIARISHPHVINLYDLVSHQGGWWLVMELVDGSSLAEHVASAGPMAPAAVARIGLQLLSALEAAHAAGALHRDVKPANVMLRRDGTVVLCDFGIAALAGAVPLTTSGGVVGSLEYIAPERLTGRPAEPAGDLFSLGATLCALLSGRSPFARPEAVAVMHAVVHEQPDIPVAAGPLRPLLEALLRKDPAGRPSIADAAVALRLVAGEASPARGAEWRADTAGTVSRRRLLRWAVPSGVLLLVGGVTAKSLVQGSDGGGDGAPGAKPSAGSGAPAPVAPTRVDAVMPVPDDPDPDAPSHYWLFTGDRCLRVRVSSTQPVLKSVTGPDPLGLWSRDLGNLPGFRDGIDAVMRVPGDLSQYWMFSRDQYVRVGVTDGPAYDVTLEAGPASISDWAGAFGGLTDSGIDAVMPVPDGTDKVWVFSGDRYVRTELGGGEPGGTVEVGPNGLDGWSGTFDSTPGFREGISAAMPLPGERNEYWVFAGAQYMKIRVTDEKYADTVLQQPRTLRVEPAPG